MKEKLKKDWFGRTKSIEELHNDSRLWISNINFIIDETRFLKRLLSTNYIDCLEAGLFKKIENFVQKLSTEKKKAKTLLLLIQEHENTLNCLIKSNSVLSNINFTETHKKLEKEIVVFTKINKRLKKQIFEIVEQVMHKKHQKKLS